MSQQTVVLKVGMSCQGCVGAVNRVLGKMEGVESFDIDIKEQKVTVKGNVEPEAVFQTVSKTGKKTSFWEETAPAPAPAPAEPEAKPVEEKPAETPTDPEPKPAVEKPAETVAAA
ncbi:copper transport protein ATX1 [Capsicum chacoense]